jgi:hypothetical protein
MKKIFWQFLCPGMLLIYSTVTSSGQDMVFDSSFEPPVTLKVATFNTRYAFNGTNIDNQYVANPANVATTAAKFNELGLDVAGLQEVHDYSALQDLSAGTGLNLAAARTTVAHIFPTAVFSGMEILEEAYYNGPNLLNEVKVRMPDGTIAYIFSIHQHWEQWGQVHAQVNSEILRRRTGSHPVLVFGDMNGHTSRMIGLSRGALSVVYDVNIDAILGTPHFQRIGDGTNHGNLGFSDHPLLEAEIQYTPGSEVQNAVPSLAHIMPPGTNWNVGQAIAPDTSVLTGITVTRLPEKGVLKLGPDAVVLDQSIVASELHDLSYEATVGQIGKDYWTFDLQERTPPPFSPPRWVDVFLQEKVSNIRFAPSSLADPDATAGWGFMDLAYANPGDFIYPHDENHHTNYDVFNANLPAALQGMLFIMNGGRNEMDWGGDYMYFDLEAPTQIYVALGHHADALPRDLAGWTKQWDSVLFNDGSIYPYDIFTKCFDTGEVVIWGNGSAYPYRHQEENMVVFIGDGCEDPEPGCDNLGIDGFGAPWAVEARDCAREDCSDGRWHSWDGKQWCRALIVNEFEDWTIDRNPSFGNFIFSTDWGAWDLNDCGDGVTTITVPECGGFSTVVRRGEVEQKHHCSLSPGAETISIIKDKDACEYVIIGNPYFK